MLTTIKFFTSKKEEHRKDVKKGRFFLFLILTYSLDTSE